MVLPPQPGAAGEFGAASTPQDDKQRARLAENYGKLPLSFEPNAGQILDQATGRTANQVGFQSRGSGYTLFLTGNEAVLALRRPAKEEKKPQDSAGLKAGPSTPPLDASQPPAAPDVLRMKLLGANPAPRAIPLQELPGKTNYFYGNDPKKWRTNVPNYAKVKLEDVYPGVDLVYYGNQRQLEYDFVVAPRADPKAIRLAVNGSLAKASGAFGRASLEIGSNGDLVVKTGDGEIRFHKPVVYQEQFTVHSSQLTVRDEKQNSFENPKSQITNRKFLDGHYVLKGKNQVAFAVPAYDKSKPLVIDPILNYSTYLGGGSNTDYGFGIAVDSSGSAYVSGYTASTNFPTTAGAWDTTCGTDGNCNSNYYDLFISKLNPAGTALVYSTYLGGSNYDLVQLHDIAVDSSGSAYVAGYTSSTNFPVTANAYQSTASSLPDAFVTKLSADGSSLLYSTYLGGNSTDVAYGIAVDSLGGAYVTGYTQSTNFPTKNRIQTFSTAPDAFVTKLDTTQSGAASLVYSTYLGGNNYEYGYGIAVDSSGSAYVTGYTASTNFPTLNPLQGALAAAPDIFVAKLSPAGSSLVYSTYLGGSSSDYGYGIAVDSAGDAYVTGYTYSTNFPTMNPMQAASGGAPDAFVSELNAAGSALVYSTYLGGNSSDVGSGIAVDSSGDAYVTGYTCSSNFPTASPLQPSLASCEDAFVTKLNATGSALVYSTYLGGSNSSEEGRGIAVDSSGAYVTGITCSNNFPTKNPLQPALSSCYDAFVSKLVPSSYANLSPKSVNFGSVPIGTNTTQTVTLTDTGELPLNISSVSIAGTNAGDYALAGTGTCPYAGGTLNAGSNCTIDVVFQPAARGARSASVTITDNAAGSPQSVSLSGTGIAPVVSLSVPSLAFGNQSFGTTSSIQTVMLTNTGNATLNISSVTTSGDFAQTNTCGGSVAAGANCAFSVTFSPTAVGSRTGSITIADNAPDSPQSVSLSGNGIPADQTITFTAVPPKTYGDAPFLVSATGGASGNAVTFSSMTTGVCMTAGSTVTIVAAGTCSIKASQAGNSNYNPAPDVTQNITINQANASVTPATASKTYGTGDPALTGTLSGFLAADGVTATYSRTAGETVAGSPYTISATLSPAGVLGNYNITYNTASFSINKANATVTPNAASKIYGTANPTLTGTLSGFAPSDNVTATYSRTAGETVAGSPYTISATLNAAAGVLSNYSITSNTASFTITPAASTTALLASPNPSTAGQLVLYTATVTDGSPGSTGSPTGTVQFMYGGSNIFSPVPLVNGSASIPYAPLVTGAVQAVYSGDPNFAGNNGPTLPDVVTAAPIASVSPSVEVQFTNQALKTTSAPVPVTLSNIGTAALAISSIKVSGTESGDFAQTNNCPASLGPSNSCIIYVTFRPQASGERTATLNITDNDPFSSPQMIGLSGLSLSVIKSDFNRKPIAGNTYIWFSSSLKVRGPEGKDASVNPVQIFLNNSTIKFTAGGTPYTLPVPNAVIVFDPNATEAKTTFDTANNRWVTTLPSVNPYSRRKVFDVDGNTFLAGVTFPVPSGGLPGDIDNVTWSAALTTDTPGVSVQWRWGAAVYTQFTTDYNALGVGLKPVDDNQQCRHYQNGDDGGTPENYKQYWVKGATGDDRDDFTGDNSKTVGVLPTVAPLDLTPNELNFGNQPLGYTNAPQTVTLTNIGVGPMTVFNIAVTGTNADDFTQTNNCPISPAVLSPATANTCTVSVTFQPGDLGTRSATLSITSGPNSTNQTTQTVDLGGNGTP